MNQQEIYEFLNRHQVAYVATCDGDRPCVRGMMTYRAEKGSIIFHTSVTKDLYRQLNKNPRTELCFCNNDMQNFIQVRVSGRALADNDEKLREEIVKARPFLKSILDQVGYDKLAVFRVKDLKATVWTMAVNLEPKEYIELS